MKKIMLVALTLAVFLSLTIPVYALVYFAPPSKPGLVFVDKPYVLYSLGDFSAFSWAVSQNTNPGDNHGPNWKKSNMLGAPDKESYLLGDGGITRLEFENLFTSDGIVNTLPLGQDNRPASSILNGIDVVIFQMSDFAGGIIYGKELGLDRVQLMRFGDGILNGTGFTENRAAILLDLDQISAAEGKVFEKLIIKDIDSGDTPYFRLDAAGVKVIPEPATLSLLGLGLLGLVGLRKRKA